jgi:hypothetical protein
MAEGEKTVSRTTERRVVKKSDSMSPLGETIEESETTHVREKKEEKPGSVVIIEH